jgi:hypothetical protein
MKKRLISLLLAFSMMLTFLPAGAVSAFAEENIDSNKGTLIPNNYDGGVYHITEANTTYQMRGDYNFPIEITAKGVTINIVGEITYGFDSYHDESWHFSYLIDVKSTGGVTINNYANYNVTTSKSDCGFVATWGNGTAAGSAIINGGRYTTLNQEPFWNSQGEMTLTNVTAECQNDLAVTNRAGTMIIDGGSYKSINSTAIYNNRSGTMTIQGNPEVVAQNGVALCSASGVVTVEGGSFSGGNGSYSDTNWTSAESAVCNWKNSKMTITGGTFTGTDPADAIVNNGEMHIANATVDAKNGSALKNQYLSGGKYSASTEIISGTFKDSAKGIDLQSGSVVLKNAEFSGNRADIYLNTGKQITIEKTFDHNATVDCADPQDGRQLTTATTGEYQKNLNLTSANEDYLVGYKTEDGKEYRCLSKKVGVTVSDPEGEVKAGDPAKFTVTLTHENSTGTGILTFGDKNSEIEYKDKNGAYQPMPKDPKDGLEVDLSGNNKNYEFRITPKDAGDQTLTAAVVRDAVELGKDSETYHVAGRVHTAVTIEGLEDAVIKEGESKDFTVKVTPNDDAKLGEAFIDFGDKNDEIEYQDKNGEYKPMPEGGLPIDLGDVKEPYAFRITPKETGKQTLTAAVKQGENKLATDEKDFVGSEMPILTLKDGVITSVTVPGKNGADPEDITEIVKKNANEDGSFHVPEGATVSVAFDKDAFADSGLKFGHWDITGLDDPNAYQDKESFAFEMPAKAVTLKAMTQDASIEDDEPDIVGPIVIGTTVVVGGAVLGYQAYSLGAEFAGKLMALPYFPSNRSALAMMLWEDAGKPMPESELLYPDVEQEEQDMDLQHAARWAMENELIPDLNDEGTAPEEMKFFPANPVSKLDVLNAWQKAQELKQNA